MAAAIVRPNIGPFWGMACPVRVKAVPTLPILVNLFMTKSQKFLGLIIPGNAAATSDKLNILFLASTGMRFIKARSIGIRSLIFLLSSFTPPIGRFSIAKRNFV